MNVDDAREWATSVTEALHALPSRQAEALRLIYEHRLTQSEVATRLGATIDETKQLVATAMRAVARELTTA